MIEQAQALDHGGTSLEDKRARAIAYLRSRGHEQTATDIETHLANSDSNFKLLIDRAREAQGLPPLP